jgi:hypothetical protein
LIATIVDLTFDVTKTSARTQKDYTVHIFTYQGDPYQGQAKAPTVRDVFCSSEVGKQLFNYKVGDRVNLTFEKNGQYQNLVGISLDGATPTQAAPTTAAGPSKGPSTPSFVENDTPTRIARAVAFKGAVDLMGNMTATDFKKADPVAMAKVFEPYLTMTEVDAELTGDVDTREDMEAPY